MQELKRALAPAMQHASRQSEPLLVSVTVPLPAFDALTLFEAAAADDRALWLQPAEHVRMVAVGAAARITGRGRERIDQVTHAWRRLTAGAVTTSIDSCPLQAPVCLGGFAFAPSNGRESAWQDYPDALLTVPRFLFASREGASWLIASTIVDPGCDAELETAATLADLGALLARASEAATVIESRNASDVAADETDAVEWKETVEAIVRAIRSGSVRKLVLARQVRVWADQPLVVSRALRRLRSRYRNCTTFAFTSGDSCFLGATPERLVRLDGQEVRVDCLAGSAPRGDSEADDRSLGQALLADEKERHEHALVVDALRETLEPLCASLDVPSQPGLLRMPNVQHLYTSVAGTLAHERHVLDLVGRLHPTPAAGGVPQQTACKMIRSYESFDRGWYAGPVGWVDGRGSGEFVVAIRSALMRQREALLYAGCGIVAASDPEREYQESCLKLEPMLWAMSGNGS